MHGAIVVSKIMVVKIIIFIPASKQASLTQNLFSDGHDPHWDFDALDYMVNHNVNGDSKKY
jgi:hypothetical protein